MYDLSPKSCILATTFVTNFRTCFSYAEIWREPRSRDLWLLVVNTDTSRKFCREFGVNTTWVDVSQNLSLLSWTFVAIYSRFGDQIFKFVKTLTSICLGKRSFAVTPCKYLCWVVLVVKGTAGYTSSRSGQLEVAAQLSCLSHVCLKSLWPL